MERALVVPALLVIASATFAQTPAASTPPPKIPTLESHAAAIRQITVGTAVPSGQNFDITLDERNIDWAYPAWARSLPGAWTTIATKEQFRSVVRDAVRRKLAATFPDGPPPDAASKMKIEIEITLGMSPMIGINIGC
ncbi:MAG TPA: hypothetical protein VE974_26745 [Thermoanaerobaculia bacterium]|nr:hypothetical protein [Thermoanaerobaculia bacterium]